MSITLAISTPLVAAGSSITVTVRKAGGGGDWTTSAPSWSFSGFTGTPTLTGGSATDANTWTGATFAAPSGCKGIGQLSDATSTGTGPAIVGALFTRDTFTGSAGDLTGHTGEAGASWTKLASSGVVDLDGSGRVYTASGTPVYYASGATGSTSVAFSLDIKINSSVAFLGPGFFDPANGNTFLIALLSGAGEVGWCNGAGTGGAGFDPDVAGFQGPTYNPGTTFNLACTLTVSGSTATVTAYTNGSLACQSSVTGAAYTTLTRVGFRNADAASPSTGLESGNLVAVDPAGGGATGTLTIAPTSLHAGAVAGGSSRNTVLLQLSGDTFAPGTTATLANSAGAGASIDGAQFEASDGSEITLNVDAGTTAGTATFSAGLYSGSIPVVANAATNQVVLFGDSLAVVGQAAINEALARLGPTYTGQILGISGSTVTVVGGQTQEPWGSIPATLPGRNVLVHIGAANDFANGVSAATVYAYLKTKLAALKAAGWLVCLTTQIPSLNGSVAAQIPAFNSSLRGSEADGFAGLCDFAALASMTDPNACSNPVYFASDRIHYASAAAVDLGELIASEAVRAQYPPAGGGTTGSRGRIVNG